jgi:hypothetical protein
MKIKEIPISNEWKNNNFIMLKRNDFFLKIAFIVTKLTLG